MSSPPARPSSFVSRALSGADRFRRSLARVSLAAAAAGGVGASYRRREYGEFGADRASFGGAWLPFLRRSHPPPSGGSNFGKLNYYLGSRAAKEGRDTPYADVDFCKDPEVICSTKKHTELKWIAGMFYWMER